MRNKMCGILVLAAVVFALKGVQAAPSSATLLVVPARPRVVQLAQDIAQLRAVTVVAYHGTVNTAEPVLHVWSGAAWSYVSLPDFSDKAFLPDSVRKTIVIGDDQTIPAILLRSMPWCSEIERLQTLDVASLINSLDQTLKFREREWEWLAGRHELTLTDVNAERRSKTQNLYDIPRSKLPLEKRQFKQEEGEPAPAELVEERPSGTPPSPAPAVNPPEEKPPK